MNYESIRYVLGYVDRTSGKFSNFNFIFSVYLEKINFEVYGLNFEK